MQAVKWSRTLPNGQNKVHIVGYTLKVGILHPCGFPAIASMLFCVNIDFPSPTAPPPLLPLIEVEMLQSLFAQSKLENLAF